MDYVRLIFTFIDKTEAADDIIDLLATFLGVLYINGQILENRELIKRGEEFHAYVSLTEEDSLDERYNNQEVNDYLAKVKALFHLRMEPVGASVFLEASCSCESPSAYLLYTNRNLIQGPVICGDCGKAVLFNKLPYLPGEESHWPLISWQTAYGSIEYVWLMSVSDRFSYRQMTDPKSQLAQQGRKICTELERVTGKPFYYFIFYDCLFHETQNKGNCPDCGEKWLSTEEGITDLRCDNCRLVANEVDEK